MKTILTTGLILSCAAVIAAEPSPITGNLALTSDYVFRGISQTQEKPAIQGGLTYNQPSGFHLGFWGSNINFKPKDNPNAYNDNASIELDITTGYGGKINNNLKNRAKFPSQSC